MVRSIDAIMEVLEREGCRPEKIDPTSTGFSRDIKFVAAGQVCYINWWVNQSYLAVGDRYGSHIPFKFMSINTTNPSCHRALQFSDSDNPDFEHTILVVLKKLDWQEEDNATQKN